MKRLISMLVIAGAVTGCTSNEEKVQKVVDRALTECKAAEGPFAEVTVVEGKDEVLLETCSEPVKGLKLIDDYHATAMIGPYTYIVGVDSENGVWVLSQVDWEAMAEARRAIAGDSPPKDARERGEIAFAKAQEEYPKSPWIRRTRFENLLAIRKLERNKDTDRVRLGDAAQKMLDETVSWGDANNQKGLGVELLLMVVDYLKDFADKQELSFENLGGSDEHLEATIRQAEKDGDKEGAAKYQATLDKERAERPAKIKAMQDDIVNARKAACAHLAKIDPGQLEGDAKTQAAAAKGATNCSPGAFEPPQPGGSGDEE